MIKPGRKEGRKKERNCQRGRLRKKWINQLMIEEINERKSEWIWNKHSEQNEC